MGIFKGILNSDFVWVNGDFTWGKLNGDFVWGF